MTDHLGTGGKVLAEIPAEWRQVTFWRRYEDEEG